MKNLIKKILGVHDGSTKNDYIVRCACGRAMWLRRSPQRVRRHHIGIAHRTSPLETGTVWEWFKMVTGLLEKRTLREWFIDWTNERAEK
jgi:hypothetical protein